MRNPYIVILLYLTFLLRNENELLNVVLAIKFILKYPTAGH